MATIDVRYDKKRACGWRRPGGKYLVGGELCWPCGKFPYKLERCPVCDAEIKPTRGWAWIRARRLFTKGPCTFCLYELCPLRDPPERAGLLWIGGQYYATPEAFIREAGELWISRRIAQIPRGFQVGETLVLLAHRDLWFGSDLPEHRILKASLFPGIFAAFIPKAIEYIVTGAEPPEELERIERQGCTLVRVVRVGDNNGTADANTRPQPDLAGPADLRTREHGAEGGRPGQRQDRPESMQQVSPTGGV